MCSVWLPSSLQTKEDACQRASAKRGDKLVDSCFTLNWCICLFLVRYIYMYMFIRWPSSNYLFLPLHCRRLSTLRFMCILLADKSATYVLMAHSICKKVMKGKWCPLACSTLLYFLFWRSSVFCLLLQRCEKKKKKTERSVTICRSDSKKKKKKKERRK